MRSGTIIAFFLGVGTLQLLSALPSVWCTVLIPPLALALLAKPALRIPICFMRTRLGPLSPSHSNHETAAAGNGGAGWPLRRSASTCAR